MASVDSHSDQLSNAYQILEAFFFKTADKFNMKQIKELRFTTFVNGDVQCEVFAIIENGKPVIQTINIVGDCVITFEDLDETYKEFFLQEARLRSAREEN